MNDRYLTPPNSKSLKIYKRPGIYPSGWNTGRIQKIMLGWAGYQCESCGASSADRLLHVHHLTWEAKHDCRFENLLVCCVNCHTRIHNNEWQPGKIWTFTDTRPDWMTARGYETPVCKDASLDTSDRLAAFVWLLLLGIKV